ncbi:MAG: hypothetical protein ABIR52_13160 [Casimicrobiaceae bacterium]
MSLARHVPSKGETNADPLKYIGARFAAYQGAIGVVKHTRGGFVANRIFFDTAAALDPKASERRARNSTRPLTRPSELQRAWVDAGFTDVVETTLTIRVDYASFVYRFPFEDIDRARAEDEAEGFAKLVTDTRGRLLGAAIVGAHAGELIAECVLAMSKGLKVSDLSAAIHTYPTLASINRRAADLCQTSGSRQT